MQKKSLSSLLFTFFYHNIAMANCPPPQTISYNCHDIPGRKVCTWDPDNGWFEGNTGHGPIKDGYRLPPDSFHKAFWYPYLDDNHGAAECFYIGPYNETVTLSQQTGYGSVPPPAGSLWTNKTMHDFSGLECSENTSACNFKFGG
jgi:hypothetical protein